MYAYVRGTTVDVQGSSIDASRGEGRAARGADARVQMNRLLAIVLRG